MNLSKLTNAGKIAGGAGIILLINLFLPWYSFGPFDFNAFDAGFLAWFGSFVAIAGAVLLLIKALAGKTVELGNLKTEHLALILGGLGTLLIILKFLVDNDGTSFGIFLGVIAAANVTAGGWMAMKEAGLEMPTADDFKSIAGGDDDSGGGGE